jgi:hypothetical protein
MSHNLTGLHGLLQVQLYVLGPNILLSTLFPNESRLCSTFNIRDKVLHPLIAMENLWISVSSSLRFHIEDVKTCLGNK